MTPGNTAEAAAPAFGNLLVPLDGSRLAESVLPLAAGLALRWHARLTLLHVLEADAPTTIHGEPHLADAESAAAYLAGVASGLAVSGVEVATHVHPNLERDVAASIVGHAVELSNDLVVLATHGSGGLRDVIAGSIAQQVLRRGQTPVLLTRPTSPAPAGAPAPSIGRVLVPLDGTHDSERALAIAEKIALAWQAALSLLRVVPTRGSLAGDKAAVATMLPAATAATLNLEQEAAVEYLEDVATGPASRGLRVTISVLRGDPATIVPEEVRRQGADFVVLATHGRAGLGAFWQGSIGSRLAERVDVPLLILRLSEG